MFGCIVWCRYFVYCPTLLASPPTVAHQQPPNTRKRRNIMLFERTCRSNTYVDNTSDTITIDDLFFCQQGTIWNHGKPIIPRSFSIVVRAHSSNSWVGDQWMPLMQGLVSVDRFPQETNSDMCISTTLEAWSCVQISCTSYYVGGNEERLCSE